MQAIGIGALRRAIVGGLGGSPHVGRVSAAAGDVLLGPVYAHEARTLEGFLLIAGYNQSGSTLIGALLNAHPDAVAATEGRALSHVRLPGSTKGILVRRILREERRVCRRTNFYRRIINGASYRVETGWQGRYARLRLVGDKHTGLNVNWLHKAPALLDFLRRRLGCPLRVLFSYRNPYDMVAAWHLRAPAGVGGTNVSNHFALRDLPSLPGDVRRRPAKGKLAGPRPGRMDGHAPRELPCPPAPQRRSLRACPRASEAMCAEPERVAHEIRTLAPELDDLDLRRRLLVKSRYDEILTDMNARRIARLGAGQVAAFNRVFGKHRDLFDHFGYEMLDAGAFRSEGTRRP